MGKQLVTLISALWCLLCQLSHCPRAIAEELLPSTKCWATAPPVLLPLRQGGLEQPSPSQRGIFCPRTDTHRQCLGPGFSADSAPWGCAVYFLICCDSRNTPAALKLEQRLSVTQNNCFTLSLIFVWVDILDAHYLHLYSILTAPKPDGNWHLRGID